MMIEVLLYTVIPFRIIQHDIIYITDCGSVSVCLFIYDKTGLAVITFFTSKCVGICTHDS
jgi:hypothetical protein